MQSVCVRFVCHALTSLDVIRDIRDTRSRQSGVIAQLAMSELGQKRTSQTTVLMSALSPKAEVRPTPFDVRFVPTADMPAHFQIHTTWSVVRFVVFYFGLLSYRRLLIRVACGPQTDLIMGES
jgi:hypothetical protein